MTDAGPIEADRARTGGMADATMATTQPADGTSGSAVAADLSAKAADTIDLIVDTVHDKAIRPLLLAARAVAFGMVAAVLGLVVMVLAAVALVRLFDIYVFDGRVWASDALLGTIFVVAGFFAWSRRTSRTAGTGGPR